MSVTGFLTTSEGGVAVTADGTPDPGDLRPGRGEREDRRRGERRQAAHGGLSASLVDERPGRHCPTG